MNQANINQTDAFYITGGNVPADASPTSHETPMPSCCKRLLQGEFCYILTSRQMGKSSLMTQMVQRLRQHPRLPAVLDLSSQGINLDHRQWYYGLLEQLGRRLRLEDEIEDFCRDHRALSPLQLWAAGASRRSCCRQSRDRWCIFIDEIDVVRSLPFSTDEFLRCDPRLLQRAYRRPDLWAPQLLPVGSGDPTDLISNPKLTPFNIGTRIELGDFSREEARSLEPGLGQTTGVEPRVDGSDHLLDGGHPY